MNSFTKKYIFALSVIAIFSISAYFNLNKLISNQEDDGKIINISGKQRMLSQRIALFAINYKTDQLQEMTTLMESSHKKLTNIKMSKEIKNIYFSKPTELDKKVNAYIKNAKSFIKNRDGKSLTYILKHSQIILKDLDLAVSIYQKESENKINFLLQNELYILIAIILALLMEAIFIFRPINKSVNKKTQDLISEKEYSDMITQTNTNAIIAVNEKLSILTFNKSAEKMFGYTVEEMLNTKLTDDKIIPLKYLQQHNSGLSNFMKTGAVKNKDVVFELEAQTKAQKLFPIRISFGTKIEKNKKIVVANIQDISSEKEKDSLLLHQSRLAAMGEMIENIAHQWRQPLSSISAIATGANLRYKNNLISDEEIEQTFVSIKEHTLHLSKTIDDFKNFFDKDRVEEVFDVIDIINKSISLIKAIYHTNNIKISIEKEDECSMIKGSSSELSQVFLNILNNAKDALTSKDIENKTVLIQVINKDQNVSINIIDNAGGISKEIMLKIFEPYFTTKHKAQGTGIGLFMSQKIIHQRFDGNITADNIDYLIEGKKISGAIFKIEIPLHKED